MKIHDYSLSEVEEFINLRLKDSLLHKNLMDSSNYVRFILVKRLPYDFCLWMDADTIVEGDVVTFMKERDADRVRFCVGL